MTFVLMFGIPMSGTCFVLVILHYLCPNILGKLCKDKSQIAVQGSDMAVITPGGAPSAPHAPAGVPDNGRSRSCNGFNGAPPSLPTVEGPSMAGLAAVAERSPMLPPSGAPASPHQEGSVRLQQSRGVLAKEFREAEEAGVQLKREEDGPGAPGAAKRP